MSDKEYQINFECPECGENHIEEVVAGVHQYLMVECIGIAGDKVVVDYGDITYADGEVKEYRCANCGIILKKDPASKVCDESELLEWLRSREMLEEI